MKYLLYYNLNSKFVTDQTAAGGDGTSVVSVVDGVAWTKDQEKTYYRYAKPEGENLTSYTLTIRYTCADTPISENTIETVQCYIGKSLTYSFMPKKITGFKANDEFKTVIISGNTTCTVTYKSDGTVDVPNDETRFENDLYKQVDYVTSTGTSPFSVDLNQTGGTGPCTTVISFFAPYDLLVNFRSYPGVLIKKGVRTVFTGSYSHGDWDNEDYNINTTLSGVSGSDYISAGHARIYYGSEASGSTYPHVNVVLKIREGNDGVPGKMVGETKIKYTTGTTSSAGCLTQDYVYKNFNEYYFKGTGMTSYHSSTDSGYPTGTLLTVFGNNVTINGTSFFGLKVFQQETDNVLLDLIPVLVKSSGKYAVYDKKSQSLVTNATGWTGGNFPS